MGAGGKGQAYGFSSGLLTTPFDFAATSHDFLHPQPETRGKDGAQGDQAFESTTKHLAQDDDGQEDGDAQTAGTLFEGSEHGFIADRGGGMEEDVCLFAMDGNVRSAALGNGIRRSGDVLFLFVFRIGLVWVGLDCGWLAEVGIGDGEL